MIEQLFRFFTLALLATCLFSCRPAHDETKSETRDEQYDLKGPSLPGPPIPPNTCRIIGTIVAIDSTLELTQRGSPCSKVPCNATVRVDSLLGYGQAFARPLVPGDRIKVKFPFTLGPSKEQFPAMSESYPGLSPGSRFFADVKSEMAMGTPDAVVFLIYGYELRGIEGK